MSSVLRWFHIRANPSARDAGATAQANSRGCGCESSGLGLGVYVRAGLGAVCEWRGTTARWHMSYRQRPRRVGYGRCPVCPVGVAVISVQSYHVGCQQCDVGCGRRNDCSKGSVVCTLIRAIFILPANSSQRGSCNCEHISEVISKNSD